MFTICDFNGDIGLLPVVMFLIILTDYMVVLNKRAYIFKDKP